MYVVCVKLQTTDIWVPFGGFMYEDFANEYIRLKGWGAPSPYCMVWGVSGW